RAAGRAVFVRRRVDARAPAAIDVGAEARTWPDDRAGHAQRRRSRYPRQQPADHHRTRADHPRRGAAQPLQRRAPKPRRPALCRLLRGGQKRARTAMSKRALAIDLIVLLAVWFVAAEALDLRMLPSPLQVLEVFWSELTEGKLGMHLLISTRRILISTALGVALAAPLAIVAAQLQLLDRFLTPLMYFLYPV